MKKKKLSIGLSGVVFLQITTTIRQEVVYLFNQVMKDVDSVIAFNFTPR